MRPLKKSFKIFAVFYLLLMSTFYLWKMYQGIGSGLYDNILFWFNWGVGFIGLLAIVYAIFDVKTSIPKIGWIVVLGIYVLDEAYNLYQRGLFVDGVGTRLNTIILAQYLILVLPPVIALIYLCTKNYEGIKTATKSKP
jgi:hypothetical protein